MKLILPLMSDYVKKINKRPNNLKRSREKDRERRCFFPGLRVCICARACHASYFCPWHLQVTPRCCGDGFRLPPVDCFNISMVGHQPVSLRLQVRFQRSRSFKQDTNLSWQAARKNHSEIQSEIEICPTKAVLFKVAPVN